MKTNIVSEVGAEPVRVRVCFKPRDLRYRNLVGQFMTALDHGVAGLVSFQVVPMRHSGIMVIYAVVSESSVAIWKASARNCGASDFDLHDGTPGETFRPQPK